MTITYNEVLQPSYKLSLEETEKLYASGFLLDEALNLVLTYKNGMITLWSPEVNYEGIQLYHGKEN